MSAPHDIHNPNPPQTNFAPTLRPYQVDFIARVALEIAAGRRRILPARNDNEPLPPDGATRAWVRLLQIAFAKSRPWARAT